MSNFKYANFFQALLWKINCKYQELLFQELSSRLCGSRCDEVHSILHAKKISNHILMAEIKLISNELN